MNKIVKEICMRSFSENSVFFSWRIMNKLIWINFEEFDYGLIKTISLKILYLYIEYTLGLIHTALVCFFFNFYFPKQKQKLTNENLRWPHYCFQH